MNEKQILTDRQLLVNKNQEIERRQNFTDKEASDYLRISQVTLWRLRKTGKISFRRAASKIIYTQADLDNYLQSTKREAFACAA
jgi:predicted ATPase